MRRLAPQRERLWGQAIALHDPAKLYRLHNVVYLDLRHFFCPASWTDEGWARHGGKDRLPEVVDREIEKALRSE